MAKTLPLKSTLEPGDLVVFTYKGEQQLWKVHDPVVLNDGTTVLTYGGVGREVLPGEIVHRVVFKDHQILPRRTCQLEPGDVVCRSYLNHLMLDEGQSPYMVYDNRVVKKL